MSFFGRFYNYTTSNWIEFEFFVKCEFKSIHTNVSKVPKDLKLCFTKKQSKIAIFSVKSYDGKKNLFLHIQP